MSIINRFLHSHYEALNRVEQFLFADNVLAKKEKLLIKFVDSEHLSVTIPQGRKVLEGEIFYTMDEEVNKDTSWKSSSLDIENLTTTKVIDTKIREGAMYYYASLLDEKGAVYTSKIEKII